MHAAQDHIQSETPQPLPDAFADALARGYRAFRERNYEKAHRIWQYAAMLDPHNEQVWLALLEVLDSDEDRKVCLTNILAINPHNVEAQRQLFQYQKSLEIDASLTEYTRKPRSRLEIIILLILAGVVGVLAALASYWVVFELLGLGSVG